MLAERLISWTAAMGLCVLNVGFSAAQDYPNKPVRLFAGGAGGGGDFAARIIVGGIAPALGQPVIVENSPAILVPGIVAKSPPDGYTLQATGSLALIAPLLSKVSYDPVRDFAPITIAVTSPLVLLVHPTVPVKSTTELIALAKARPGELNFGTAGTGSAPHLSAELFKSMAGINVVMVPYKGITPAVTDLISGQLQLMITNEVKPHLNSGRLRALAVTSLTPTPLYPGLPTIASTLPGYESVPIIGIWAPVGTPTSIINRLNQEIVRVLNRTDVKEKFFNAGAEVVGSTPAQFGSFIKSEVAKWGKIIREAGIQPVE